MDFVTVYLLIEQSGEYEANTYYWGVFSSEKKAEEMATKLAERHYILRSDLHILKFTLDHLYQPYDVPSYYDE